ncbi:melibiase [Paenibacillus taihuensis]|uniref:Melibiase n=1 Tax=Paenibacillus taihuensis TaxID=1156355 RepID=A0A3D9R0K1_9BACL|nr:glycoside hydrolase family 36 protein [Paenibacillus taihuensis]REE66971.1 melibiase [Paenibacillus taihuensis]
MVEPILELGNDHVLIEYDCSLGTFDVKDVAAGAFVMGGVHSGFTEAGSDGGGIAWATGSDTYISSELDDATMSLRIKHLVKPGITLTQHFTLGEASEDGYLLLQLTVENESVEPLRIEELRSMQLGEQGYLQIGSDPMRCLVYTDPYYKIPAAVREVFDGFDSRMFHKAHSQGIQYLERDYETPWHSTFDGVIKDPLTGYGAVFGYTTCRRFLPQIAFTYNKEIDRDVFRDFTLLTRCEGRGCEPGETLEAETCYLYLGYDIERAQEQYADLIASSMGAVKLDRPVSGWCSWHYAFFQVTEDDVERNLRFAAEHPEVFTPEPGGFEYILIDYGWQQTIGSPAVNKEQFPRGMKRMADMIREAGFRPGIWIAPFWIEADAEIVTTHPEYLLHHADGSLALGPRTFKHPYAYRLDLSHPGAQQYVLDQLTQLIHEWGYALIKMDFLEVATVSLTENRSQFRYHSDDRTSIEILRDMCKKMQALADAANNDIWLSPCGSPVMALCGIFKTNFVAEDAIIRFIPDRIHMHGGVKAFAQTLALRRYYQDRIWTNNYESVILRARDHTRKHALTSPLQGWPAASCSMATSFRR